MLQQDWVALVHRVTTSPCAGRRVPGTAAQHSPGLRWGLRSLGSQQLCQDGAQLPAPSKYLPFWLGFGFFLQRLRCHMALAVLPSARHSLALLLSNSAPSPKSKILTLGSTGGMGAAPCRERGCVPQICAERGGRRSWVS